MDICELLKEIDDMGRLCQRFLLGRAEFADLVAVHTTIGMWSTLQKRVEQEKSMEDIENPNAFQTDAWRSLDDLFHRMSSLQDLSEKISAAVIINVDSSTDINDIDVDEPTSTAEDNILDSESLVSGKSDNKKWAINPKSVSLVSRFHDHCRSPYLTSQLFREICKATYCPAGSVTAKRGIGAEFVFKVR